jgi:hypothetical protein
MMHRDWNFVLYIDCYFMSKPTSMRAIRARYNPYLQARHRIEQVGSFTIFSIFSIIITVCSTLKIVQKAFQLVSTVNFLSVACQSKHSNAKFSVFGFGDDIKTLSCLVVLLAACFFCFFSNGTYLKVKQLYHLSEYDILSILFCSLR